MAKILLVEDDKSLREIYGVRLLAEGYDIVSAGDGEEALAMAIKERPELIVSDVMMPKISGFDMLDILRSTTETKNIKVIMMTALSSEDQRQRGEQLGADRYLVKSQVGIEDVVRTVHEVLADAPVAGGQNPFATPVAPAAPTQATTPAPVAPAVAPAPTPVSTPQQPASVPAPAAVQPSAPAPAPVAPAATPSQAQAPLSQSPSTNLPQPTAPFSTARPAGLADRVIHPIERPESESTEGIASLIDKELGTAAPAAVPAPTPESTLPPLPPAPTPPEAPLPPQQSTPSITPPETSGISFEETPRA